MKPAVPSKLRVLQRKTYLCKIENNLCLCQCCHLIVFKQRNPSDFKAELFDIMKIKFKVFNKLSYKDIEGHF